MFKEKLILTPDKPGCYLMKDKDNNIIYIGKAKNLKKRLKSYFNKVQTGKTKALVDNIKDFEYIVTNSEVESLILELNLIKKYSPKYNILLKDDKTYPYIELTDEKYPVLKIIRKKTRIKTKSKIFGPFPNVMSARKTVELINRLFPLRKCKTLKKDVCLYYHIGECLGYCKYDIEEKVIKEMTKEIIGILNGDYKYITTKLELEMQKASSDLNYEKALELKNVINDLKVTINKQIIVSNIKYNFDVFGYFLKDNFLTIETLFIREGIIIGKKHKIFSEVIDLEDIFTRYIIDFYDKFEIPKEIIIPDIIEALPLGEYLNTKVSIPKKGDINKILNMANLNASIINNEFIETIKKDEKIKIEVINSLHELLNIDEINRIELFDNSHLFGTYYVGAMVVYEDLIPNKKEYRKYKINVSKPDDLEAMKEIIYRRYYKVLLENLSKPDLIIVDGGETQVRVTKEIIDSLNLNIKIIGLKKDDHHKTKYIIDDNFNEIKLPSNNNLFLYLTRMQDEVHRYAIAYHRDIKSKGMIESILENVSGIGDIRRKELLKKYGSINKIKEASIEDLSKIIPDTVAKELKEYLENI